jgi:predicted NAD/FAD-binding protein
MIHMIVRQFMRT